MTNKKRTTILIDEAVWLSASIKTKQTKTNLSRYIEQLIVKDLESEVIYKKGKTNE